jgi:hypothetical protein
MTSLNKPFPPNKAKASGYLYLAADGCPTLRIPVDSADRASALFAQYRDQHGIGSSEMSERCGNIHATDGVLIARVSYNGRVWTPDGTLLQEPPHYPNDTDAKI